MAENNIHVHAHFVKILEHTLHAVNPRNDDNLCTVCEIECDASIELCFFVSQISPTSAPPISRMAHEAVCQSIRVKMYTPLLVVIGRAATKQNRHVPAVTCVKRVLHWIAIRKYAVSESWRPQPMIPLSGIGKLDCENSLSDDCNSPASDGPANVATDR